MKLNVPYYSQFVDLTDPFWMLRACGVASLKMASEFCGAAVPDLLTLCVEAKERGGYDMQNGWVHDYMVMKARELGLEAERKEGLTDTRELLAHLDAGYPIIVSVEKRALEQKRFHMLVLVGYEKTQTSQTSTDHADIIHDEKEITNNELPITNYRFFYHEPESTDKEKGRFRVCDEETFLSYFRGKAIFITPRK